MALIKCAECNNEVSDRASSCPKCGAPLGHSKIEEQRAAITQSRRNEDLFGLHTFQVLIVAIVAGVSMKSWLVFGGTLLGLMFVFMIPVVGTIVAFALAGVFGFIGFMLGNDLWGPLAGFAVGGLFFLISLGASTIGSEYLNDISKK